MELTGRKALGSSVSHFAVSGHKTIFRNTLELQGYYPRIIRLANGELVASVIASTTIEAPDSHPVLCRSKDGGLTWQLERPINQSSEAEYLLTETGFISQDSDGSLLCLGSRWPIDPDKPKLPIVHEKTLGMRNNQMVLRRSSDGGHSWTEAQIIPKPVPAPLEVPSGITVLQNGSYLLTCATWRDWDGNCPYGHRILMTKSTDKGKTWSPAVPLFHDESGRVGYWEGRVAQLSETALIATCWAHDWNSDQDLPNHFTLSNDLGETWSSPSALPILGQTGWALPLENEQVVFVYNHRRKPEGIRAQIALLRDRVWTPIYDDEVWSPQVLTGNTISKENYGVSRFQFGAPSALRLDQHTILVIYWCVQNGRAGIDGTIIALD